MLKKKKLQNTETLTILKDGYISIYIGFHNHVLQYSALAHIEKLNSYFMGKEPNQLQEQIQKLFKSKQSFSTLILKVTYKKNPQTLNLLVTRLFAVVAYSFVFPLQEK